MPWKECSVMEERLRFVARLLEGEAMSDVVPGVRHLAQDRLQDLRPLQGARARGADRPLAPAGALRQPAAGPDREPDRRASSGRSRIGARARSASSWSGGWTAMSASRPRAPSTPFSTATAWSSARGARATAPRGTPLSEPAPRPTICGAPTSRASSSSATARTATRSPSPTTPRASCSCAKLWNRPARDLAITAFEQLFLERGLPQRHPLRQRRPLRQPQRPVQPLQALRLVAQARHRHRAHQARPPAAERPPRAHAPDPEEGSHPAARHEQPAATGPLRRLRRASSTPSGRTRPSP